MYSLQKKEDFCKEKKVPEKNFDAKICNMAKFQPDHEKISQLCESKEYDGTILPLNVAYNAKNFHRTFAKYPYCKPSSCTVYEINGWYQYLIRAHRRQTETNDEIVIQHNAPNSCDENEDDKALIKKHSRKVKIESCGWLQNRSEALKSRYCRKKNAMQGFQPAHKVCPRTCCRCIEDKKDTFLRKFRVSKGGKLKLITKTCEWLQQVDEEIRRTICKKGLPEFEGYFSAKNVCPSTCEICSNKD